MKKNYGETTIQTLYNSLFVNNPKITLINQIKIKNY